MWILLDKLSLFSSDFSDCHKNRKDSEKSIYGITDSVTHVKTDSTTVVINERTYVQNV